MESVTTDVLVVGAGAAGLRAAYEAKRHRPSLRVTLLTLGRLGRASSTDLVASESLGINAPLDLAGDGDSPDEYLGDMLSTGLGLADERLCRIVADEAADRVLELMNMGVEFDGGAHPTPKQLSGCSKARSLAAGGATGRAITTILGRKCRELGVEIREGWRVTGLCQEGERVTGLQARHRRSPVLVRAKSTVLATGGAGLLFARNVNSPGAQADGWALALNAGATLTNVEFFQIGPGVVWPPLRFIIHSGLWRLAPSLTNGLGEPFLARYCPTGTDPGDVVAAKAMSYPFSLRTPAMYLDIAMWKEIQAGRGTPNGGVYLDVGHVSPERLLSVAPVTCAALRHAGVDLSRQPIEIAPVVQNFTGGIAIDADGFTGVEGLWAAGEATGGVHGADRPGGNNLTDSQVFGRRAGIAAADAAAEVPLPHGASFDARDRYSPTATERRTAAALASSCDRYLTVVRTREGLRRLLDEVEAAGETTSRVPPSTWLAHRLLVTRAIATAALERAESRGTHYREDAPTTDPRFERRLNLRMVAPQGLTAEWTRKGTDRQDADDPAQRG